MSSHTVRIFPSSSTGTKRVAKDPNSTYNYQDKASPAILDLYEKLKKGDRYSLAKAITLVESNRDDHRAQASHLVSLILSASKYEVCGDDEPAVSTPLKPAFRIGLSGPPGVGKSTFIENFGMKLVNDGHKVAVLAVDPSSSVTGGSILGDKTRMTELSRHDSAYVRPSPSSGTLGGVARNTNEAIILCEGIVNLMLDIIKAAGYDVVLVETVGVGQSETLVADIVDMFVLLIPPSGGDELQGIKKGIVEIADMIIINKADGQLLIPAQLTQLEYVSALKLLKPQNMNWRPPVVKVSALENSGLDSAWKDMLEYYKVMKSTKDLDKKRAKQRKKWLWRLVSEEILRRLKNDESLDALIRSTETRVLAGDISPGKAADQILHSFFGLNKLRQQ